MNVGFVIYFGKVGKIEFQKDHSQIVFPKDLENDDRNRAIDYDQTKLKVLKIHMPDELTIKALHKNLLLCSKLAISKNP